MPRPRPTHGQISVAKQLAELGECALHAAACEDVALLDEAAALALKFGLSGWSGSARGWTCSPRWWPAGWQRSTTKPWTTWRPGPGTSWTGVRPGADTGTHRRYPMHNPTTPTPAPRRRAHSRTFRHRESQWRRVVELALEAADRPLDDDVRHQAVTALAARLIAEHALEASALLEIALEHLPAVDDLLLAESLRVVVREARRRVRAGGADDLLLDAVEHIAALPSPTLAPPEPADTTNNPGAAAPQPTPQEPHR